MASGVANCFASSGDLRPLFALVFIFLGSRSCMGYGIEIPRSPAKPDSSKPDSNSTLKSYILTNQRKLFAKTTPFLWEFWLSTPATRRTVVAYGSCLVRASCA
ncbi:hypothetical protein GALMADRAFT_234794 [Galerina marginata CBS 339.88]|uniref:Uncharacterized protein n=1 Tax=Galerina marginata (strain CBS 339.88) TaxID=685588 RepID=A0A067U2V4_GALM3|nr:hypothetical protein GALMADRAFT_234794 [Galerina marginata CBS 339.88]